MRILILTPEYPPYILGGIGTFSHYLAKELSRVGVDVVVMAGCPAGAIRRGSTPSHESISKNLELIRIPRMDLPPSHFWYEAMNTGKLRSNISNFDVVHAQYGPSFPFIYCSKKHNPRVPWAITVHTGPLSELHYAMRSVSSREGSIREFASNVAGFPLWDLSFRIQSKLADALVPVSQDVSEEIQRHYNLNGRRIFTIHTGVNVAELKHFAKSIASTTRDSNTRVIRLFYAGRLQWRKGVLHLLKSIAYLTFKLGFSKYQLEIFGRGPLAGKVSSVISELHLTRNVALRGFVTNSQLFTGMAESDIVCVPSLYEACPLSMIEAMAMGKPVVAFDRPFSRELLDGVPDAAIAKGVQDYAALLHILSASSDLRTKLGKQLQVQAAKKFDMKIIAEQYIGLYKRLMS